MFACVCGSLYTLGGVYGWESMGVWTSAIWTIVWGVCGEVSEDEGKGLPEDVVEGLAEDAEEGVEKLSTFI